MTVPLFQSGDTVRPGMAVAEIPDLKNWELAANIAEPDRGHLSVGQKVDVAIIAVPRRVYRGYGQGLGRLQRAAMESPFRTQDRSLTTLRWNCGPE